MHYSAVNSKITVTTHRFDVRIIHVSFILQVTFHDKKTVPTAVGLKSFSPVILHKYKHTHTHTSCNVASSSVTSLHQKYWYDTILCFSTAASAAIELCKQQTESAFDLHCIRHVPCILPAQLPLGKHCSMNFREYAACMVGTKSTGAKPQTVHSTHIAFPNGGAF